MNAKISKNKGRYEREQTHPLIFPCFSGLPQQLLHAFQVQLLVDLFQDLITLFETT